MHGQTQIKTTFFIKQSYAYVIKLLKLTAARQKNNCSSTIEKRPRNSELSNTLLKKRGKGKEHEEENVSSYWMTLRNDVGSTRLHPLENSLWKWLRTCRKAECLMNMQVYIFWAVREAVKEALQPTSVVYFINFFFFITGLTKSASTTFSMAGRPFTLINFTQ